MENTSENSKRIAINTLLLYFRMLFVMGITLYTSRVILRVLGVEDFGIYNVVGGVVAIFGFLNTSMTSATQRFLTFELGENNFKRLQKVFSISVVIHIFIVLLVVFFAFTIGLWFFKTKMTIPEERMESAYFVYIFSILSAALVILNVPYNAIIIAHEKMKVFAYISILEVILKLLIVYLLVLFDFDKLKLYAILVFSVQFSIRIIYGIYCTKKFPESKLKIIWDKKIFHEMTSFAGWSLFGNIAGIAFTQGLNLLLNIFFSPVINAARGIAIQVQHAVSSFSMNFQMALNPQIIKSYAKKDFYYMYELIYTSSKFSFFLLWFLSLPILIEVEFILKLWLNIVPDYTGIFIQIILSITLLDAIANPLMKSAEATGRIKRYHSVIGSILLCILPVSYIVLKLGYPPYSVFIVHFIIAIIAFIVRLFIVHQLIKLPLNIYFKKVLFKIVLVVLVSLPLPLLFYYSRENSAITCGIILISSWFCVLASSYFLGLNLSEKTFVKNKFIEIINRVK